MTNSHSAFGSRFTLIASVLVGCPSYEGIKEHTLTVSWWGREVAQMMDVRAYSALYSIRIPCDKLKGHVQSLPNLHFQAMTNDSIRSIAHVMYFNKISHDSSTNRETAVNLRDGGSVPRLHIRTINN